MQRQVLPRPDVREALADYVTVQLDAWRTRELAGHYGVFGAPTFLVLHPDGAAVSKVVGYVPPERFIRFLRRASGAGASAS